MLRVLIVAVLLVPIRARADSLEAQVARANYLVWKCTGKNFRPHVVPSLRGPAGLTTHDGRGAHVWIARDGNWTWEQVMMTVFHEAGHASGHHQTSNQPDNELWADEFAGRLVACTHGDLRAAMTDSRLRIPDATHDSKGMAVAVFVGYVSAGGEVPADMKRQMREHFRSWLADLERKRVGQHASLDRRELARRLAARHR
jgi:hypothetical protein